MIYRLQLQPQQLLGIAAGDSRNLGAVEFSDGNDMADGIVFRHVEGIIRSHDDAIAAEQLHQREKLVRREHHGVDVDLPEIGGGRLRQIAVRV